MISVPNLLLPSNGSRNLLCLLIPVMLLFSCRASRTAADAPAVVPIVVQPGTEEPKEKEDSATAVVDQVVEEEKPFIDLPGKTYRIALLLPFDLSEFRPAYDDTTAGSISRSTRMAVEFYQGFQLAVEKMDQPAIDAEVFVFDTGNDPNTTRKILHDPEFPDADLIIGPVYNKNLRVAAEYCKREKIPMISPLSSSSNITSGNPYYYSANGTSTSHYEALVHHIKKFHPDDTLHIIHNGSQRERRVIDLYKTISLSEYEGEANPVIEIEMTTESNTFDLRYEFDSLSNHVVFIPSYDEIFTNYALSQLAQIKTYYPSVVYGMPTWINFSNANYDYFEWLQVHITESYWIDEYDRDVVKIRRDFTRRYGMEASEYALQGYDLAHFVIAYLSGGGGEADDRERFFIIDEPYKGLQTSFRFIPRFREGTDEIDFWDNQYIHVLKFENYQYNKVD